MKGKTLAIAIVLMVLLSGGWLWLQKTPAVADTSGQLLLPELQGRTGEVTQIEVILPGELPLQLSKEGDNWQLALPQEHKVYPAAASTVGSLLRSLVDSKTLEAKTARPEHHARLNLAEQGEGAATRIRLELKGASKLELLVGKAAQQGDGQLVRKPSENQVWLIDRAITLPADNFLGWINRRITSIPADEIKSLELKLAKAQDGHKTLLLSRDKAADAFKVREAGDTAKPAVQDAASRVTRLFAALNLNQVTRHNALPEGSQTLLSFILRGFNQEHYLSGQLFQQQAQEQGQQGVYWLTLGESQVPSAWLPAGTLWAWQIEDFAGQTLFEALPKALAAKTTE